MSLLAPADWPQKGLLCLFSNVGVPNLWASDWYRSRSVRNGAAQQEVSFSVMSLNHPETIAPILVCGKIVFHETGPWCQKGWGLLEMGLGEVGGVVEACRAPELRRFVLCSLLLQQLELARSVFASPSTVYQDTTEPKFFSFHANNGTCLAELL